MTSWRSDSATALPLRPTLINPTALTTLAAYLGERVQNPRIGAGPATDATESAVTGISANSALIVAGDLFAALPGTHSHGVAHLAQARARGAVAVLTDPAGVAAAQHIDLPTIVVADPRAVLGPVSAAIYGNPSARLSVLGVTGTSGKTTTTALVRAGLEAAGVSSGLIGTLGIFVGGDALKTTFTTPEAPQLQALLAVMLERGISTVAMEVSSHALRLGRVGGIDFTLGAFTNLSQDHLDFHTDMNDYFQAKSLLFDGRAKQELVVIDDSWGARLRKSSSVTVSGLDAALSNSSVGTVSERASADWYAESITDLADGSTEFTAVGPEVRVATGCRIPGRYNVSNMMLALAMLACLELDVAALASTLARAQVPGRMQRVDLGQPWLTIVDYSHKPAGVAAALQALRPITTGRLIIVLGCGGDRDRAKRPVMGQVAARLADVVIVTDDNPRSEKPAAIRAAMLEGARGVAEGARIFEQGDRAAAIGHALALARSGDTVLIAGKGHETGQEVGGIMLAFDDVDVATAALMSAGYAQPRPRSQTTP